MPLTEAGNKIKEKMHEEYGDEKGDKVFYSKENADKKFKHTVTGKGMEDKSIKESRSEYPASEEGFTTSMGPADLSGFAEASATSKSSPLWWAVRLNKLPAEVKAKIMKSLNLAPAVTWWNERIETLTNHLGNEEDDKEEHTR